MSTPALAPLGLDFLFGRGYITFADVSVSSFARCRHGRVEIPDVRFPVALGGGLERFRSIRGQLRSLEVTISARALAQWLERVVEPVGWTRIHIINEPTGFYCTAAITNAPTHARIGLRVYVRDTPDRDRPTLSLQVQDALVISTHPIDPRRVTAEALRAILDHPTCGPIPRYGAVDGDQDRLDIDLARLATAPIFLARRWKLPGTETCRLTRWSSTQDGFDLVFDERDATAAPEADHAHMPSRRGDLSRAGAERDGEAGLAVAARELLGSGLTQGRVALQRWISQEASPAQAGEMLAASLYLTETGPPDSPETRAAAERAASIAPTQRELVRIYAQSAAANKEHGLRAQLLGRMLTLTDSPSERAELHRELAQIALGRREDPLEARQHLERALQLTPTDPQIYQELAELCLDSQRYAEAVDQLEAGAEVAKSTDATRAATLLRHASQLAEVTLGDPGRAYRDLRAASKLEGDLDNETLRHLATCASDLGRQDDAREHLARAISNIERRWVRAGDGRTKADLISLLEEQAQLEEARGAFEHAARTRARILQVDPKVRAAFLQPNVKQRSAEQLGRVVEGIAAHASDDVTRATVYIALADAIEQQESTSGGQKHPPGTAAQLARRAVAAASDNPRILRAATRFLDRDERESVRNTLASISDDPLERFSIYAGHAQEALDEDRLADARRYLSLALRERPDEALNSQLGEVLRRLGHNADIDAPSPEMSTAIQYARTRDDVVRARARLLDEATPATPGAPAASASPADARQDASLEAMQRWLDLADRARHNEDWPDAVEAWTRAAEASPTASARARALAEAGIALHFEMEDSPRALPLLRAALQLDPVEIGRRHDFLAALEIAAEECNDPTGTLEAYSLRVANAATQEAADDYRMLACNVLLTTGQARAALEWIQPVVQRRPDDLSTQRRYADVLAATGRTDVALRILDTCVAQDDLTPFEREDVLRQSVAMAHRFGDTARTRAAATELVAMYPDDQAILDILREITISSRSMDDYERALRTELRDLGFRSDEQSIEGLINASNQVTSAANAPLLATRCSELSSMMQAERRHEDALRLARAAARYAPDEPTRARAWLSLARESDNPDALREAIDHLVGLLLPGAEVDALLSEAAQAAELVSSQTSVRSTTDTIDPRLPVPVAEPADLSDGDAERLSALDALASAGSTETATRELDRWMRETRAPSLRRELLLRRGRWALDQSNAHKEALHTLKGALILDMDAADTRFELMRAYVSAGEGRQASEQALAFARGLRAQGWPARSGLTVQRVIDAFEALAQAKGAPSAAKLADDVERACPGLAAFIDAGR